MKDIVNKITVLSKLNLLSFINGFILMSLFQYPILFILGIISMHIMVYYLVWSSVSTKPVLTEIKNQYQLNLLDIRYIIIWAIIEGISYQFVNLQKNDNIWYNIVTFIPVTFLCEIVYDLVFYLHHYISHKNKAIYRLLHKTHHQHHNNINIISLYYTDPIDIIINAIYIIIITYLVPIYELQFFIWIFHKLVVELAGHSGTDDNHSCFSQFIFIPRLLDIDLNKADHFLHHLSSTYNYSKRFSLWDKVFGTYQPYKTKNKIENRYQLPLYIRIIMGVSLLIMGYLS